MNNKCLEMAIVEKYILHYGATDEEKIKLGKVNPIEADVIINIRNKQLRCFVHDPKSLERLIRIEAGDLRSVRLYFLNFSYKEQKEKIKRIEDIRTEKYGKESGVNYYRVSGQIIEIQPSLKQDLYKIIVDCGVIITINIEKDKPFRIGDWIQCEGRLDAYFVEFEKK